MPIVVLLSELGLISEGVAAIIGAIASAFALLHAWKLLRGVIAAR
jgi:hypothetical protein